MSRIRIVLRELLVAALVTASMLLLRRYVLLPWLEFRTPFIPLWVGVAVAAWIAGLRAGLLATALGVLAAALILAKRIQTLNASPRFLLIMTIFVVAGVFVSWLVESARAARQRMARRQAQLESEISERQRAEASERVQRERLAVEVERRAAAEAALGEREERIRMAVESAAIGTWDLNPVTGERNWSARTKTMFGLGPDADVTDISFLDRIHPDDRQRAHAPWKKRSIRAATVATKSIAGCCDPMIRWGGSSSKDRLFSRARASSAGLCASSAR